MIKFIYLFFISGALLVGVNDPSVDVITALANGVLIPTIIISVGAMISWLIG